MFFSNVLYQADKISFYSYFAMSIIKTNKQKLLKYVLNIVKCFFLQLLK